MELLLPKTAFARVEAGLAAIAPELDLTFILPQGTFERGGRAIPASQVDPDIVWFASDAIIDGYLPALLECVTAGTQVKWMQSCLAGHDRPVFREIVGKGVRLSKSTAPAVSIAEYATAHAFGLIVPIAEQRAAQHRREWTQTPYVEIGDSRWTVFGFGAIGLEITRRVKAYGAHVTIVRRHAGDPGPADAVMALPDIGGVLPNTDVVILACALNDQTRHLADDAFFDRLKTGAILINVGRGALIDSEALQRGLERDRPRFAVLDAFEQEPLQPDHWMWGHPKVHVSAHTSAYGKGTFRRNDEQFLVNLARYLAGESGISEVTRAEVGL